MGVEQAKAVRIAGLDVLRGVAVALVIAQHALRGAHSGTGVVGVAIFFALSGYLITGVLLSDLAKRERVRYGRFYLHRALRLIPALAIMLIVYVVFQEVSSWGTTPQPVLGALIGITYTSDLPHLVMYMHSIGHLWSLAVEEQFYLVWPTVLLLAFRHWRLDRFVIVAAVIAELAALAGPAIGRSAFELYYYPTSWAIALVIGAAAKVYEPRLDRVFSRGAAHLSTVAAAVAVLVAWSVKGDLDGSKATYWLGAPTMAASSVVLIFWVKHWIKLPTAALSPLLGLGTVSYAAYLWNLPVSSVILSRNISAVAAGVLAVVVTVAIATANWFFIERPIRDRREAWDRRGTATSRPEPKAAGKQQMTTPSPPRPGPK